MRQFSYFSTIVFVLAILSLQSLSPGQVHAQTVSDTAIAQPFVSHYWRYRGERSLGLVQSALMEINGYPVQYFEKGRLEDHSRDGGGAAALMYGRLTVEMMEQMPMYTIGGTSLSYGDLYRYGYSKFPVPPGFTGGTMAVEYGVFIPADTNLQPAPGYIVPFYFWNYINRADMFPRGWLRDVGLPLTDLIETQVLVDGVYQTVMMQAFERTILSYNPNTAAEVDRLNIGTDALLAMGQTPLYLQPVRPTGPKRIEINLSQQYLYAFEGDFIVYEVPVSTGRNGWETPAGSFTIFSKLVSQDMRGSANGEEWFVPNVPHVMYFASGGYAIHGTYWHNAFGSGARLSHGCVNAPLDLAAALYAWAPLGTPVIVHY